MPHPFAATRIGSRLFLPPPKAAASHPHPLDQLSATLLHQLALDGSVRIVATVRAGQSAPDAITSLWKDGYLQRLHLMAFTKDECVGLIEQALGGRVEGLSSDLMWEA